MITVPLGLHLAEGETSSSRLLGLGSTPIALLSANLAVDAPSSLEDPEKLQEDLLRRVGTADPWPWRHGGLNE